MGPPGRPAVTALEVTTRGPRQTRRLGAILGEEAQEGDIILLEGDLGTGKTCLAQGIAQGLGVPYEATSPSFVIINEYRGRLPMFHIDLYRLDDVSEMSALGLDEYLYGTGVCVVEWADKAPGLWPAEHLLVRLQRLSPTQRRLRLEARGRRYEELLRRVRAAWS